ncbi:LysM peptidoglycan-binding domain-containing protein [Natranaerobius trueperi]|uniref:LysM peptidoglycan-binding domain-containing protein n=1 Tax=Natranaerobius trueperi TaxID=759412 RepID=UPI00197CAC63|nr:LysM peptidoglycan-binding domain-containing protein [Natranaerobius trueperi]
MSVNFKKYTIRPGDTLCSIAKEFMITKEELLAANPHLTDNKLSPKDILWVPEKRSKPRIPEDNPPTFEKRYTVKGGDTAYSIAQKFNVDLDYLIKANPHIPGISSIEPGDILCVPKREEK